MTSFLLFFCSTLFLFAENSYSQNARVTIKERNVPLETVLDEIENQSDYLFIYDGNQVDVNKNVSVNAKSQPVSEVLTDLLADSQVKYVMEGTHIVLLAEGATSSASPQQTQSVSGVVTDATGEPLAGVSIAVKGTTIGAITDVDGKYSISVPSEESVLTFSFIGFTSQEITAGNRRTINVELKENVQQIEDVVVIGYGTVKKSDLTGSVASISNRQFQNQPLSRVDDILKGRTPGAMVLTNSGSPDKNISVRIRGANSIYGGNDPLYIIDGVPSGTLDANTNDIQSIEVLKDASATAIYGSRGANGVILITTKRGAEGKTQIQLETQNSWSSLYKKFDMLSAADFAESYNEFRNGTFTQDQINAFKAGTAGTDWQDLIFRTAYSQNHKLTISGGTNKARYYISGNFEDNQGVVIESDMRRYALRSNIQADVTNWLKVDMDLNGYSKKTSGLQGQPGSVGSPVADALMYSPVTDLKDAKGNWLRDQFCSLSQNPYGRLVQNPNDSYWNGLTGNLKLTFLLPVKGLTFNMQGAATYTAWSNFYLNSLLYNLTDQDSAGNSRNDGWDFYNLDQLNYTHQWGDHRLTAMVAGEFTKSVSSGLSGSQSYLLTESVGYWNLSMGDTSQGAPILSNWYNDQQMASVFGRGEYSFKDRYLLTATIRRDGSSKFQGKNKWGNFPSASLAWRAAEESFIKNLNVFDNLKLRLSYGVTGSQAINPYGTLGLLASTSSTWGDPAANYLMGYYIGSPAAPNLTWEKTYQYDLGLDLGFFHNRLSASIDIYQKTTKGLLLQKPIPLYDGGGSMWVNLGQVRNKGIDLQLSGIILQSRDWHWESTFNFSYNKNAVLDLGGQERMEVGSAIANGMSINTAVLEVGQPMGSIQGYTWLGLWKTSEADEAAKMGQQPGDNHFKDFNGDGVIDANDISVIGHAFPDKILGWNNTVSWRRFDLNVMFQGAFGADRLNIGRYLMNVPNSDVKWMTGAEGWFNRWTPDNENTWVPNPFSTTSNLHSESQQFLESANYVRLSNLSIAYTLPKSLIKFCDLTLMLSAQNLVTFTGYKGGDPESTMSSFGKLPGTVQGNTDTNAGIDAISYPQPRSFTVGAKLSF